MEFDLATNPNAPKLNVRFPPHVCRSGNNEDFLKADIGWDHVERQKTTSI